MSVIAVVKAYSTTRYLFIASWKKDTAPASAVLVLSTTLYLASTRFKNCVVCIDRWLNFSPR